MCAYRKQSISMKCSCDLHQTSSKPKCPRVSQMLRLSCLSKNVFSRDRVCFSHVETSLGPRWFCSSSHDHGAVKDEVVAILTLQDTVRGRPLTALGSIRGLGWVLLVEVDPLCANPNDAGICRMHNALPIDVQDAAQTQPVRSREKHQHHSARTTTSLFPRPPK